MGSTSDPLGLRRVEGAFEPPKRPSSSDRSHLWSQSNHAGAASMMSPEILSACVAELYRYRVGLQDRHMARTRLGLRDSTWPPWSCAGAVGRTRGYAFGLTG